MKFIDEAPSASSDLRECAYNLFRNTQRPMLFCAVPEHCPVPSFINAQAWSFARVLRNQDRAPSGFHDRAARAGVQYNGFYLFQAAAEAPVSDSPLSGSGRKHETEWVADSLHSRSQEGAAAGDAQHLDRTFATQSLCVVSN